MGAGQQGGVQRHVVGAVVAVAARAFHMLHDHPFRRQAQRLRQVGAQVVGALRVRPDAHGRAIPQRHGAASADAAMGDEGLEEAAPHHPRAGTRLAMARDLAALGGRGFQPGGPILR